MTLLAVEEKQNNVAKASKYHFERNYESLLDELS